MSLYISEQIQWDESNQNTRKFGGGVQVGGGIVITGSLSVLETNAIGSGTLGAPVVVLSGSGNTGAEGISGSIGVQLSIAYTSSLAAANPTAVQLTSMFPSAQTWSLFLVGSGSESWLVFKDIQGTWRTMTASFAG